MSTIKNPNIPAGIYPTNDTLITMTVDTDAIMAATTQEEVIACVNFTDNQGDPESDDGPNYVSTAKAGNFITWIGAIKNAETHSNDQVLIYDISNNSAMTKQNPSSGYGRTHQDARAINNPIGPQDYTVQFWVWSSANNRGQGFMIDPKLQIH